MAEAESAIKALIETATSNLASSTSVYAVLAPQGSTKPYVTFEVLNETVTNVMGTETTPTEALFQINVFADTFLEIVNITNDMRTAFNRYSGTINSVVVQDIFFENRNDFYDEQDRDYQRTLDFRMFFEE